MKIKTGELLKIAEDVLKDLKANIEIVFFEDKEKQESGLVQPTKDGFFITIPNWVLSMGKAYAKWYIIHECTHCLKPGARHNKEFKALERAFCLKYGLKLKYGKVYPTALYDLNDNLICTT